MAAILQIQHRSNHLLPFGQVTAQPHAPVNLGAIAIAFVKFATASVVMGATTNVFAAVAAQLIVFINEPR